MFDKTLRTWPFFALTRFWLDTCRLLRVTAGFADSTDPDVPLPFERDGRDGPGALRRRLRPPAFRNQLLASALHRANRATLRCTPAAVRFKMTARHSCAAYNHRASRLHRGSPFNEWPRALWAAAAQRAKAQVGGNNSLWCESAVGKADFEAFQAREAPLGPKLACTLLCVGLRMHLASIVGARGGTQALAARRRWRLLSAAARERSGQVGYGQVVQFYGNKLLHFTKANDTASTRISIDWRVVRKSHFLARSPQRRHKRRARSSAVQLSASRPSFGFLGRHSLPQRRRRKGPSCVSADPSCGVRRAIRQRAEGRYGRGNAAVGASLRRALGALS